MAPLEKILMPVQFHGMLSDGSEITVPLRISKRCKRMILRSLENGFEIVVPPVFSSDSAERFFREHLSWIEQINRKRLQYQAKHPPAEKKRPDRIFLPFTGEDFQISWQPLDVCWTGVRMEEGKLIVSGQVDTWEQYTGALRKWLIRHAETTLLAHAENIAVNHDFAGLTKLRTGIQKCSWGTCSRRGVVTLNAALLFFTKPLAEYVILHELCHLTEMNHSIRFWTKLESVYPGAKEAREALKSAAKLLPLWVL